MDISDLAYELDNISDEEIRNLTREVLEQAPPHFWYRPASSTGKYHAPEENEQGGLVLHTKRVCRVAEILMSAWYPPFNPSVIRSACLLHDICKYGDSYSAYKYTLSNHPKLAADFIRKVTWEKYPLRKIHPICNAVLSHMGRWGSAPSIETEDFIVHLADVVATRIHEQVI